VDTPKAAAYIQGRSRGPTRRRPIGWVSSVPRRQSN